MNFGLVGREYGDLPASEVHFDRASRACIECTKRKAKCDYVLPSCSRCTQRGVACFFPNRRRPGPRKGLIRGHVRRQDVANIETFSFASALSLGGPRCYGTDKDNGSTRKDYSSSLAHKSLKRNRTISSLDVPANKASPARVDLLVSEGESYYRDLRSQLVLVYLANGHRLFPCFPVWSRARLLELLAHAEDNTALIDSVCAIATRFCDSSHIFRDGDSVAAGDEFVSRAKSAHVNRVHGEGFKLDLDVIKTSLLLTLYHYTRHPRLKDWAMAGETTRLAYDFDLDKLDPPADKGQSPEGDSGRSFGISDLEMEDRRHVFWSIWKLDIFYSGLCCRPFGVDSRAIQTYLPSSSYEDLVSNTTPPIQPYYLATDVTKLSRDIYKLNLSSIVDIQRFYFIANTFVRSASELRRLNLASLDVNHEMFLFEFSLASVFVSLPDVPQNSEIAFREDFQMASDRIVAESIMLMHLSTIIIYMPTSNDQEHTQGVANLQAAIMASLNEAKEKTFHGIWHKCSRAAISIVDIVKSMSVKMISTISPTATSSLWLAGVVLTLHRSMTQNESERERLCSSIGFLLAVLQRLGRTWASANALYLSLESITTTFPTPMTFLEICQLLKKWNGPYEQAKTGAPSLLAVADNMNNTVPVEPLTAARVPLLEMTCEDQDQGMDFDMESFNSDLWPIESLAFFNPF